MSVAESAPTTPVRLTDRIDRAVLDHPDGTAIRTADSRLSYREFGELVDGFVAQLTEHTGPGEFVGIDAERGSAAVVAMAGSLKARRPFVLLDRRDSDVSNERKVSLLSVRLIARAGTGGGAVLSEVSTRWRGPGGSPPGGAVPGPPNADDRLAYAISTSGSTGRPKCVLVRAAPLDRVIDEHVQRLEVDTDSRTLQFARLTFDGCITEIFWTLTAGACLVVLDEDHLIPGPVLEATLAAHGITHFKSTPFALTATTMRDPTDLRHVVNGGGVCRPATMAKWAGVTSFHNAYGTTETTVCNFLSRPLTTDDCDAGVPLGDLIGDCDYYLAAPSADRPAEPPGQGELVIVGEAVAEGYLTADGLQRFDTGTGARHYRTGDRVERRDGRLYFLERLDRQVKVRGFRLDPTEVEIAVCRHPAVDEAAVLVDSHDGDLAAGADALICYYHGRIESRAVREHLEVLLDPYKIPSVIEQVEQFPYTPNGKVDHAALQAYRRDTAPTDRQPDSVQEDSPQEKVLGLVRRLTGVQDAGPDDNFFDIGGDSNSAVVLTTRLKEWGWVEVGVRDVLRAADLGSLADRLRERSV